MNLSITKLVLLGFLIAILAFGAGYLLAKEKNIAPIIIEKAGD